MTITKEKDSDLFSVIVEEDGIIFLSGIGTRETVENEYKKMFPDCEIIENETEQ